MSKAPQPGLFSVSAYGTHTARDQPSAPSRKPPAPHNRTQSSRDGAEAASASVDRQCRRILAALREAGSTGCTNQELAERCGFMQTSVCGRTDRLRKLGLIVMQPERRLSRFRDGTKSKLSHQVWTTGGAA